MCGSVDAHMIDDVFCVLDATQQRSDASVTDSLEKTLLVKVAATFLVWRITATAKYGSV